MGGRYMGSIDLNQSAGLYLQPEATHENPQNLSGLPEQQCHAIFTTPFPHPHTKEKKRSGLATRDQAKSTI